MSRIGKQPVEVPANVKVKIADGKIVVEGPKAPKGLEFAFHPLVKVAFVEKDGKRRVEVQRSNDDRFSRSLHGLTRSVIANMVEGVVKGYEKKLKIEGIGYQARMNKKAVVLTVGYANAVEME